MGLHRHTEDGKASEHGRNTQEREEGNVPQARPAPITSSVNNSVA